MNLQSVLRITASLYKNYGDIIVIGKTIYPVEDVIKEIERFAEWADPNLDTESLCKVIRCKDCKHYKKMKKKSAQSIGSFKTVTKTICELDDKYRPANYFCADAVEKVKDSV